MPVTKSAQKQVRVSEKNRLRNKSISTLCKTNITKAEKLIFSGDLDGAQQAVVTAISSLDKAVVKGVIHSNNAARRKSRLMQKLNEAKQALSPAGESPQQGESNPPAEAEKA